MCFSCHHFHVSIMLASHLQLKHLQYNNPHIRYIKMKCHVFNMTNVACVVGPSLNNALKIELNCEKIF